MPRGHIPGPLTVALPLSMGYSRLYFSTSKVVRSPCNYAVKARSK